MAYKLITAEGYPWENGVAAITSGMPACPSITCRIQPKFSLDTNGLCPCHNHPFDRWTQMEYYQMASYTYGISSSKGGNIQNKIKKHFENQAKGLLTKTEKKQTQKKHKFTQSVQKCFAHSDMVRLIQTVNFHYHMTTSMMTGHPSH